MCSMKSTRWFHSKVGIWLFVWHALIVDAYGKHLMKESGQPPLVVLHIQSGCWPGLGGWGGIPFWGSLPKVYGLPANEII